MASCHYILYYFEFKNYPEVLIKVLPIISIILFLVDNSSLLGSKLLRIHSLIRELGKREKAFLFISIYQITSPRLYQRPGRAEWY